MLLELKEYNILNYNNNITYSRSSFQRIIGGRAGRGEVVCVGLPSQSSPLQAVRPAVFHDKHPLYCSLHNLGWLKRLQAD